MPEAARSAVLSPESRWAVPSAVPAAEDAKVHLLTSPQWKHRPSRGVVDTTSTKSRIPPRSSSSRLRALASISRRGAAVPFASRRNTMSDRPKWKETGGEWLPDHTLLSDDQLAKCARAYDAEDGDFPTPVPTRVVSNGEYMPPPQSPNQKKVDARLKELADSAAKKLGVSRRQFLGSTGGTAAAFIAMNDVFGRFCKVDKEEMFEPAAHAQNAPPKDLFVVDDQLHFVRGSQQGPTVLRAIAQGPTTPGFPKNPFNPNNVPDEHGNPYGVWNPALVGMPITPDMFHIVQYIRSIYFDSQVSVGLISNVTAFVAGPSGVNPGQPALDVNDARTGEILTAAQTAAGRDFINELAGSRRAMAHGLLYVGKGNLDYIQYQIDNHSPDAWKGYGISHAAKVDSGPMRQWRQDDPNVAYPTYELITK